MAKQSKPVETRSLSGAGLESYEVVEMHRSDLKGAEYNPRILDETARKKLKAGLKKHGMVTPPTFNKRTGNVVGGHQRLGQLDSLMGTANYTLKVAVIDVDAVREKEINVLLNNQEAAGVWDLGKLGAIMKDTTIDIEGTGFDAADVMKIFGDTMVAKADDTRFDELALQLDKMRETFKKIDNREAEGEFYFLAIFRNGAERDAFLKENGMPLDRYQSGDTLRKLIRVEPSVGLPDQQAGSKSGAGHDKGSAAPTGAAPS